MSSAEALERDGFTVLRGAIPTATIAGVAEEYARVRDELRPTPPPKDEPFVLYWTHVRGAPEPRRALRELPALEALALDSEISRTARAFIGQPVRLYEIIMFAKPPKYSEVLHWHQDASYFPVETAKLLTMWIPLYRVTKDGGALHYVPGSHRQGVRGIIDLLTGQPIANEDRPLIPQDPEAAGYSTVCCEVEPGDVIVHEGHAWHMSGPNRIEGGNHRLAVAIRYGVDPMIYRPHPANDGLSSRFAHLAVRPGDRVEGPAFPLIH